MTQQSTSNTHKYKMVYHRVEIGELARQCICASYTFTTHIHIEHNTHVCCCVSFFFFIRRPWNGHNNTLLSRAAVTGQVRMVSHLFGTAGGG